MFMSAAAKIRLTPQEYFAREREASFKSEFYQGEMFAMAGASSPHNFIKGNLEGELFNRLKGSRCRTLSSDQRVQVERTGFVAYPDLMIVCGQVEMSADDADTLNNPVAIVDVLSPSSEKHDRGFKLRHYQQIASLQEYILIAQDEPVCERFTRQPDGSWNLVSFVGLQATLFFTSVDASIPLADLYRGVTVQHVEI
jgi:Uma2 family endonuclease